jgi:hypothetical protein
VLNKIFPEPIGFLFPSGGEIFFFPKAEESVSTGEFFFYAPLTGDVLLLERT